MGAITSHFYDQFRRPRGPLGHLAGRIMSKRSSNAERSRWTVDLLELTPGARVLEVGFGPGLGVEAALSVAPDVYVVGLDHSSTMRKSAARRNDVAVRDGRLTLRVGDAQSPPSDLGTFDAIFSCNVWLFWADPVATLSGLAAQLEPGGQLAVTHLPRHGDADASATAEAGDLIETQLKEVGLIDVTRHTLDLEPAPVVCVIARSPGD
ncbi:MAG: class I SAM-dependent methyltransferase [Acidimicrobiia bacterium]|nr:class I SAM-dependent methyltransferase [Acidimicrobiia bacterium]